MIFLEKLHSSLRFETTKELLKGYSRAQLKQKVQAEAGQNDTMLSFLFYFVSLTHN